MYTKSYSFNDIGVSFMLTQWEQEELDAIKQVYFNTEKEPLYLHYSKADKIYSSKYNSWWTRSAIFHCINLAFGGREPEQVFKEDEEELIMYFDNAFRMKKYYNGVLG